MGEGITVVRKNHQRHVDLSPTDAQSVYAICISSYSLASELGTYRRLQSSEICHVDRQMDTIVGGACCLSFQDTAVLLEYPEDGGSKLSYNIALYVPFCAVSFYRRLDCHQQCCENLGSYIVTTFARVTIYFVLVTLKYGIVQYHA
jgi:hypothetical protein